LKQGGEMKGRSGNRPNKTTEGNIKIWRNDLGKARESGKPKKSNSKDKSTKNKNRMTSSTSLSKK